MKVSFFFLIFHFIHNFIPSDLSNDNKNQAFIKKINLTHFSCDNGKILPNEKFNDDFCDCLDGSDENLTNACYNGQYYCKNKLYYQKIISTSKLNDGFCDCCDGSDERNIICPNSCLYYTDIEYNKLSKDFNNLQSTINGYTEENIMEYFNDTFDYINDINETYNTLKKLYQEKFLIERYLDSSTMEKNDTLISEGDLKKILNRIKEEINKRKNEISEEEDNIYSLLNLGLFNDLFGSNKLKVSFKNYNCDLSKNKFYCKSHEDGKTESLNFGQLNYIENNIGYFNKGYNCNGYPDVLLTAEVIFLCGNKELFELNKIENHCFYSFFYYTYIACNNEEFNNIIGKINKILNH